jgi:hypothetical protein
MNRGALYTRRVPGSAVNTHFMVVERDPGVKRPVELETHPDAKPDEFSRTRPLVQWLVVRAEKLATERARAMPSPAPDPSPGARFRAYMNHDPRHSPAPVQAHALVFVGIEGRAARFLVEVNGRKRLQTFELGDGAEKWGPNVINELNALAAPAQQGRKLIERYGFLERLETQYNRSVSPIGQKVEGRVERLITTAQGDKRAVIVSDRSLHVLNLPREHAQDARQLLGQRVAVARSGSGLSLSLVNRTHKRALRIIEQSFEASL